MKNVCPIELCTGCMACLNSCIHNAIKMGTDICGFQYPIIIDDLCVNCNLCVLSCPVNFLQKKEASQICYAAIADEEENLLSFASGGIATVLSNYVIRHNGVVYGCSGEDMLNVKHIRVTKEKELLALKGSKYVQSYIGFTYRDVKNDLCKGFVVLFIGTPCQIAGLKGFLKKEYKNLITIDIVCHGVPSQKILNEHILKYEKKYRYCVDINSIHFREKISDMNSINIRYGFYFNLNKEKKCTVKNLYLYDTYMLGFLKGLFLRNSCYHCIYASPMRIGDITLCDFWGISNTVQLNISKGVSAVLINTRKGIDLFEKIKDHICYERRPIQEAIDGNGRLQFPTIRHSNNVLFRNLYSIFGFEYAASICLCKDLYLFRIRKYLKCLKEKLIECFV